jgi:hypothetical protein
MLSSQFSARDQGGAKMAKKKLSFEEWLEEVEDRVAERFDTSLSDLEDDFPRDVLRDAFDDGLSPATFVRESIEPLFDEKGDDDEVEDEVFDD